MTLKHSIQTIAVALTLAALLPVHAAEKAPAPAKTVQKTYAAPEEAARALADAIRADDMKALLAVVGPDARGWLSSGDDVADREGSGAGDEVAGELAPGDLFLAGGFVGEVALPDRRCHRLRFRGARCATFG